VRWVNLMDRELYSVKVVDYKAPEPNIEKKIKALGISKPVTQPVAPLGSEFKDPNDDIPSLSEHLVALIKTIKENDVAKFTSQFNVDDLIRLRDSDRISLLHIATRACAVDVIPLLLSSGADPSMTALVIHGNTRAYDYAGDKATRDVMRAWRGENEGAWEWNKTGIPVALSEEGAKAREEKKDEKRARQREKEKERKRENREKERVEEEKVRVEEEKQRVIDEGVAARKKKKLLVLSRTEKNGAGMSVEARARLDRYGLETNMHREKRAIAAESRMRNNQNKCSSCNDSLAGLTPFTKFNFKYVQSVY
jgi:hypothetical protein